LAGRHLAATVHVALTDLEEARLIQPGDGHIVAIDRQGLVAVDLTGREAPKKST